MKFRAHVFKLRGNSFLIPGYWYPEEEPDGYEGMSPAAVICDSMMVGVIMGCDAGRIEWKEFEADEHGIADFTHILCQLRGSVFKHGAIDAMLFAGPMFDIAMANTTVDDDAVTVIANPEPPL